MAGGFVLNGAGEVSGLTQVPEWGLLETPILLTNTMSVGKVSDAAVKWMTKQLPGIGSEDDVIIPLVGECDDSWLNDAVGRHVRSEHVYRAIEQAARRPGRRGLGRRRHRADHLRLQGRHRHQLAPGGRSSGEPSYTLGVLVQSNFGVMRSLRVDGVPVGEILEPRLRRRPRREHNAGSIIRVVATDAPLLSSQLVAPVQARGAGHRPRRLVRRARLGRDHRRLLDRQPGAARRPPG